MDDDSGATATDPADQSRHSWVLMVVIAACWVPLVVVAVALAAKGWTPVGEFAQAELRVRDFWANPPSLGAVGRLRTETDVSSHPGPAAWWAMYPIYAIGQRSAAGLSSAVAATAGAWITVAVVLVWRRAGDLLALLVGFGTLSLMAGLGAAVFVEPWNPWFAVMAFLALTLATWSVTVGARWSIVVVSAASTWCVQTHLGFAPVSALLVVVALFGLWQAGPRIDGNWRRIMLPLLVAGGVAFAMWLPPIHEQITGDPGNISTMVSAYGAESGAEGELGIAGSFKLVGTYLDPRVSWLLLEDPAPTLRGLSLGSLATLGAWALAAVVAFTRRHLPGMREAILLQLVATVSLVGALLAASRIPGEVFGYLVLWLAVTVTLLWIAIVWTLLVAAKHWYMNRDAEGTREEDFVRPVRIAAAALLVVAASATAVSFTDPSPPGGQLSDSAAELVAQSSVVLETEDPDFAAAYVLRWEDPAAFGALGTAVLSELERMGFTVGVDQRLSTEMRPHRVLAEAQADAAIWVVSGDGIERWREIPGVEELAFVDPRSGAERARQETLAGEITAGLQDAGVEELADELARNAWVVRSAPEVGLELDLLIDEYVELGFPSAVFLTSVGTAQPPPD